MNTALITAESGGGSVGLGLAIPGNDVQFVLNNLRDMESDAAAGKRTLATLIGRQRTLYLLAVLAAAAFAIPIVVFMSHLAPVTVMAVHFAIPIAAVPVRTAFATTSPPRLGMPTRLLSLSRISQRQSLKPIASAFGPLSSLPSTRNSGPPTVSSPASSPNGRRPASTRSPVASVP